MHRSQGFGNFSGGRGGTPRTDSFTLLAGEPAKKDILDGVDNAIRMRDKVLLILSEHSIGSHWVKKEVNTAFEEEDRRHCTVLFPLRVDDAVMMTEEAWAAQLRRRHIGDFRRWKDHDGYTQNFERVLRDLKLSTEPRE